MSKIPRASPATCAQSSVLLLVTASPRTPAGPGIHAVIPCWVIRTVPAPAGTPLCVTDCTSTAGPAGSSTTSTGPVAVASCTCRKPVIATAVDGCPASRKKQLTSTMIGRSGSSGDRKNPAVV